MAGFGGAVKLTGESEYRKALQQITINLKNMSSALKTQAADFNSSDKSLSSNAEKQKELNKTIAEQQEAIKKAQYSYSQYTVSLQAQQARHNALNKEYKNAVLELDRIAKESGTTSQAYQDQAKAVSKLEGELVESTDEMNKSKSAMANLKKEISNAQKAASSAASDMENLGEETKNAGKQAKSAGGGYTVFKNVLANLGTQAINAALNGLKNLGGAFLNIGKQALSSYSEFEQLEGGVKKLFGDEMANTVIANANNAFKTAGMSANEYMETVTSFSASLISGLKGDTAKSAEIADIAIKDMSDNANTFGTDIASIQSAYQNFAKGNFVLLDNLKLGYGGSAGEMARLVNESGVLGNSMKVTAETVKNVPFSDLILAINKTQERMGILGATNKEAMSTIEGSTNATKSAWQNMLTGMASDTADFDSLVSNFVDSLMAMLNNILPRIQTIIKGMSTVIAKLLRTVVPEIVNMIPPLLTEMLPVLVEAVQNIIRTVLDVLPQIMPIISKTIPQIVTMLLSMLPELVDAGIQIILSLIDGISEAIPQLLKMLPDIIKKVVDVFIKNLPQIIKTGVQLLIGLINGLSEAIPKLIDYIPQIIGTIVEVLIQNLPMIIDSAVQIIVALVNGLIQSLPKLIAMVPKIIVTIVQTLIKNLPQIIQGGVQILASLIQGLFQNIGNLATKAKELGQKIIDKIKEVPGKMLQAGKDIVKGLWEGISNSFTWLKNKIKEWVGNVTGFIKKLFGINSPSTVMRDQVGKFLAEGVGVGFEDEMKNVSAEMADSIPKSFDVSPTVEGARYASHSSSAYADMIGAFKEALAQMKIELDDEVAGKFVEQTVARTIYA